MHSVWGHCDLLKTYQSYERMEEEAATRRDLLHFLSFDQGKVREKSGNFEKRCLWQPYILPCLVFSFRTPLVLYCF